MAVFTCTDHDGFNPVGTASVVIAGSEEEAKELLDQALLKRNLSPSSESPYTLTRLKRGHQAVILRDGDY